MATAPGGLALLVRMFGDKIAKGYEVFIPDTMLQSLSPHDQMQEERDNIRGGTLLRYFPSKVIEGGPVVFFIEDNDDKAKPKLPNGF
jgi:hypothetical protein